MKEDKETRQTLLACAREEFVEKGFKETSLRNICKKAGVTTGALYFFFEDKEDLFSEVVQGTVSQLTETIAMHFQEEKEEMERASETAGTVNGTDAEFLGLTSDSVNDLEVTRMLIHCLYQNKDIAELLALKSQGTRYEYYVDQLVDILEAHYRYLADCICKVRGIPPVSDFLIHWISHEQIDIFIHLLTHIEREEEALDMAPSIMKILYASWFGLFD